jgi:hypothetical protein
VPFGGYKDSGLGREKVRGSAAAAAAGVVLLGVSCIAAADLRLGADMFANAAVGNGKNCSAALCRATALLVAPQHVQHE